MEKGNIPEIAKEIIDLIVKHDITVGEFERLILKVKDQFSELIVKEKEAISNGTEITSIKSITKEDIDQMAMRLNQIAQKATCGTSQED